MRVQLLAGVALGLVLLAAGCSRPTADAGAAASSPTASAIPSAHAPTHATPASANAHDMSKMAMPASAPSNEVGGVTTPEKIKDFTLMDQDGKPHELYAMKDAKAVVLIWQGVGCPIVQQMTPAIKEAAAKYEPKGVNFMLINSNIQDTPEMIKQEVDNFDIKMPALKDADQKVGLDVGVQRTAEVVVIDPKQDWKILYHGPLDDRLTYGRARAKADNNWATDVLDAALAGKQVPVVTRPTDGCIVNFPTRQS